LRAKIAIADDHPVFRKGIIKLLDADRYEFLFDVGDGKELIDTISEKDRKLPDIMIMDIKMPGIDGYEAVAWLKTYHPSIEILVVSSIQTEEDIVRMLKLGVKGYLSKIMEPEDIHAALQAIMNKDYYFTDFITNKLVHSLQHEDTMSDKRSEQHLVREIWADLSENKKKFIQYACTEMTYIEIAGLIFVSPKTIDKYRDELFDLFNIKSRVGLVIFAIKNNLVTI
jgi:two-component system, NarL family, invasion response regulator UvrY